MAKKVLTSISLSLGSFLCFLLITGLAKDPPGTEPDTNDSSGCMQCHSGTESMHRDGDDEIGVTCVGCHGGNGSATQKNNAHVQPQNSDVFGSSANPKNSYAVLNNEDPRFIRFMNPGDLRVAEQTCGRCHQEILNKSLTSIMAHSSMVPQAGLYNNGIHPGKIPSFGEAYMPDGTPAIISTANIPGAGKNGDHNAKGPSSLVTKLEPLPAFEMIPATDAFRVLERGNNDAGTRGPGTDFHIAGGGIVLHKTRLNDPTLWFIGTNEAPGDYRNSGCTACHVLYANDRNPDNSGPQVKAFYDKGGKSGYSDSKDQMIPKDEVGHPIKHQFTTSVPVSQCLTCHHHQGNGALGNYVGAMWWDQESDADKILEPGARRDEQNSVAKARTLYQKNSENDHVQIEDWHGHIWNFRRVYKRDREGNLLDAEGNIVPASDPGKFDKAVHLKDIHFEKGMHCIDCHTENDVHGDGQIWGAMIDGIEIRCEDCHGTSSKEATLVTSGVSGSTDMAGRLGGARTPFGTRQFEKKRGKIIQRSKMVEDLEWEIPQLVNVNTSGNANYNEKASRAHTLQRDGATFAQVVNDENLLAHSSEKMECYTCHSAWNTQCYGCHLSADVNRKADASHYEGQTTKAYVEYNPQVLRADAYLIGINGTSKGNKYSPMRSASAVVVSARDGNRVETVHQQTTISAPGYSGFAVTPNPPHTVRTTEVKQCTDCHVSENNDNNAWLSAVYGFGTNAINFIGEYAYVAEGKKGIQAVKVTEGREPQPIIGSPFHEILDPASFREFVSGGRKLETAYGAGSSNAKDIALRGEFIFIADGPGGFKVYDRSNISRKDKSQRILRAQNSRFGQKTSISTRDATALALPTNAVMNLNRKALPQNLEQPISEIYRYAYITDSREGLITVDVNTFHDNNPQNNYIERAATYNPENKLSGAVDIRLGGNYAYIVSQQTGFQVVDISKPRSPRLAASLGSPDILKASSVMIQFRYAFITDSDGLKVIDITYPEKPELVLEGTLELGDARDVYLMRSYAYVAAGRDGLAIIDIKNPEKPKLVEKFTANGAINDAHAVTTGTVNASFFAFIADGRNGLQIVRLVGPPDTPGHLGFSPKPVPKLVATYKTKGAAVAVAEGVMRDRPVDESGNQIGVGGRLGSHPLTQENLKKLTMKDGKLYRVKD